MRVPQPSGHRGSLKWIQLAVQHQPELLGEAVRAGLGIEPPWTVDWRSPRFSDQWAEYRDAEFLEVIGLSRLSVALDQFWPKGGPQWDALGASSDGGVVLVEAKAHVNELSSSCKAENPASVAKIDSALRDAQAAFGANDGANWTEPYYQYANRLAHLWFLRKHGVVARLAFVYYVGDAEMKGPESRNDWAAPLADVYATLGLNRTPLNVCDVFIDVANAPELTAV